MIAEGPQVVVIELPDFFTEDIPIPAGRTGPGMGPAIVGTLVITGAATVMAVPLGVLGAIYLHEYGGKRPPRRGSPLHGRRDDRRAVDRDGPVHLHRLDAARSGYSAFGGALALACLMLPVVIRTTEEMLRSCPTTARGQLRARAPRKSRTILTVVLPAALPGIVSAAACWPSPAPPARPRRCCSPSAS